MRIGRPPKPPALKLLEGNPGKRKINFGPSFSEGFGAPPRWLKAEAKRLWKKLRPELEEKRLSARVYRPMFESLCYWYGEWKELAALIEIDGRTFTTPNGYMAARPELLQCERAFRNLHSACVQFGLTPASSGTIKVPDGRGKSIKELLA